MGGKIKTDDLSLSLKVLKRARCVSSEDFLLAKNSRIYVDFFDEYS
jgi:hypothetical protein